MNAARKAALASGLLIAFCGVGFLTTRRSPSRSETASSPKPVAEPARPMVQIYPGHVEAQHTIQVDIAQTGKIAELFADVGQDVMEGQVIARLATGTVEVEGDQEARKHVEVLKSAIEETRLQSLKAKADAQHARDEAGRARKAFELQRKLNDAGATPRRSFEQARDDFAAAQKEAERAEESWRQSDNRSYALADQLREAGVALDAASKKAEAARVLLSAAEIHAPASGIVVERNGSIGQQTGPADGKAMFQIAVDVSLLRAVFDADVQTAAKIQRGTPVLITVPAAGPGPISAAVSAVEGLHAEADFVSPAPPLRPGMPCTVSVQLK